MIYLAGLPLVLVSALLLVVGGVYGKPWALYSLKVIWFALSAIAVPFTLDAWKGSSYSENWEMIGVFVIVWPITGLVCLSVVAELFILRGKRDFHSRLCRTLAWFFAVLLIILSVSPMILGV